MQIHHEFKKLETWPTLSVHWRQGRANGFANNRECAVFFKAAMMFKEAASPDRSRWKNTFLFKKKSQHYPSVKWIT